jgi:N-acetylmuramoyl-L-alanine amidase
MLRYNAPARRLLLAVLLAVFLSVGFREDWVSSHWLALAAPQDIEVREGSKRHRINSRENQGQTYYEVRSMVNALGLKSRESGGLLTLSGARGDLILTDGRSLVRFREDYVLLSQPVWRRRSRDWYVPEDFLNKALPLILSKRFERQAERTYLLESVPENNVRVEVANHPDHVRIVFIPSLNDPIRVREFGSYLEVDFGESLVHPIMPRTRPDDDIVSAFDFDTTSAYGIFRIHKGEKYFNFREYSVSQPHRKVIDLYAPPVAASIPVVPSPSAPAPPPDPAPLPAQPSRIAPEPVFQEREAGVIALDPGHGGEDSGVDAGADFQEKDLVLRIARRLERRLQATEQKVVLTRTGDSDLPADYRSAIGNHYRAKGFVSIHTGGAPSPSARGPVVYYHRYMTPSEFGEPGEETRAIAALPVRRGRPAGTLVLWEEGQRAHLRQSRELATALQKELNRLYGADNQPVGVPLALLAPVMAPAVLVEVGFLTSNEDQAKLRSADFQEQLAAALERGIVRFLERAEEPPPEEEPEVSMSR